MKILIFIISFYDSFYSSYINVLAEETEFIHSYERKIKLDTLQNPFYEFFKAIEYEKKGFFFESLKRLEKALEICSDSLPYLVRFYIISLDNNIKSFEEDIKRKLLSLKEKKEWDGVYFLSNYLLIRAKSTSELKTKEFFLQEAIYFSPGFYPAYLELIKLHLDNLQFLKTIQDVSGFLALLLKSEFLRKFLILAIIRGVFFILYYFLILFIIGKIISFAGYETTYLKKYMKTTFPLLLIIEIIFILLAIPPTYHLLLLLPLFPFFSKKEKVFSFLLTLMVISIFYFGEIERKIESYYSSRNYPLFLMRIKNAPFSKKVFESLDTTNLFEANIKGILLAKRGKLDTALIYFRHLLSKYPENPYIFLNTGNIFYLKGEIDSAYFYYKKTSELNPNLLEPHFNIAQIGIKKLDIPLYEREIKMAQEINYEVVAQKTTRIKEYGAEEIYWGIIPFPEKKIDSESKLNKLYGFPFAGLFTILILIFLVILFPKNIRVFHCSICGCISNEIFRIEPKFETCRKCASEISKTESIKIRTRIAEKLKVEARERKKFITFLLNLLLPPLGFIFAGSHFFFTISFLFLFIGFYTGISLKLHFIWIGFYIIYLAIFVFPFYYFKEVKIGSAG